MYKAQASEYFMLKPVILACDFTHCVVYAIFSKTKKPSFFWREAIIYGFRLLL